MKNAEQEKSNNQNPNPHPNYQNKPAQDNTRTKEELNLHPKVVDKEVLRNSGKETGLVDPPIVSVAPASGKTGKSGDEPKILSDVSKLVGNPQDEDYEYSKLELEQGLFIPVEPNTTTDMLLAKINKSIHRAKIRYGVPEVDENGDEILDQVCVKVKKRNEDGTIQLNNNVPITGATFQQHTKYIYSRNFIAKPVMKDQEIGDGVKAESDGVVIIRVA